MSLGIGILELRMGQLELVLDLMGRWSVQGTARGDYILSTKSACRFIQN
jgi:hypothetical protein